jgi:hypothetical protein
MTRATPSSKDTRGPHPKTRFNFLDVSMGHVRLPGTFGNFDPRASHQTSEFIYRNGVSTRHIENPSRTGGFTRRQKGFRHICDKNKVSLLSSVPDNGQWFPASFWAKNTPNTAP